MDGMGCALVTLTQAQAQAQAHPRHRLIYSIHSTLCIQQIANHPYHHPEISTHLTFNQKGQYQST